MAKIRNVPFPRPCGATGNDAQKLHAPAFAHFRGAMLRHEVFCPFSAEHTANQAAGFTTNSAAFFVPKNFFEIFSFRLLAARQSIVQKLTQARLEKGLSQEQLAKRIGTQRSNICRIEKGTQNLSLDLMLKIAEALDKDVSVMLEERSSTMEKVYSLRLYDETLLILRSTVAGGLYRRGRRRMCDCSLCWHIRW